MFKLDNNFLTSLGLGSLPVDEKNKLLQAIYERLEMNVGMRLAEKMTDDQLNEFEGFIDRSDEAGALRWLETNFPNYKQVVAEELEKLKAEVSASAPQILAAAQQAPVAGPEAQQPMMPPNGQQAQSAQPDYYQQPQATPSAPDYQQPSPGAPQPQAPQPQAPQQPSQSPTAPWEQPPAGPNQQPPAGFPPQ